MSLSKERLEKQFDEVFGTTKPVVVESTYADDVQMLEVEMGDIRKKKADEDAIMLDEGDSWSQSQWNGYDENNAQLINRLAELEEYRHNLG